jgi:hypothetical protein
MTDKPKSNPILGIADWLAQESRLEDAQTVLASVKKSKKSTEEDLKAAEKLSKAINVKSREAMAKIVQKVVVYKPTNSLKPHKDVEEKLLIKADDYQRIKKDVDERGIQVPLVVNDKNEVVCGVTRWKVCKELDIKEVPCFLGSWDLYQDMFDYAIKDNVVRRQLSNDELSGYNAMIKRERGITPVGRPPITGTKREVETLTRKTDKIIAKEKSKRKSREVEQIFEKDYRWVVGKNHLLDDSYPTHVGKEITNQLTLLKQDKREILLHVKYEVKELLLEDKRL